MAVTVATGFSPEGKAAYGDRALATFDRHWPKDVRQLCYVEQGWFKGGRADVVHLDLCNGVRAFINRHKDDPEANGRKRNAKWRQRDLNKPYAFRFNAVGFCRQLFIPEHAAHIIADGDIFVWLDGDVITLADVPPGFVESLLGTHDIAYLGRPHAHSEIGFWALRMSPPAREFLTAIADCYRSDAVFDLAEWHSAFVWDHVRRRFEQKGMTSISMTDERHPMARRHPWHASPLSKYTDHLKGRRKELGVSPERR